MNPIKLLRETDSKPVAVACGKCGQHWSLLGGDSVMRWANECCDDAAKEAARVAQRAEFDRKQAENEVTAIAKAKRIPESEYTGWLFWEDGEGHNDGYFANADEIREWCDDEGIPLPAEVWACYVTRFTLPSADSIVEDECERGEYHESIGDFLTDTKDLQAAIDAWNARQSASACSYHPDNSVRVVLAQDGPK